MDPLHLARGREAEDSACAFLTAQGMTIMARNVRYRMGEIDIIAKDGSILCFVEVRSRSNALYGTPQATVGYEKQSRIIKAAMLYLKQNYKRPPFCRFDVVALTGYGADAQMELIKSAFEVPSEPRRRRGNPWQVY